MFLDDTACNLASANLLTMYDRASGQFDVAAFEHLNRLWTVVLEISVMMAQFPSKEIAELSYRYRTLGLGFANIGGLLMSMGLPYDSHQGRALAGALTAIMTGVAYATSAEMAAELGPFPGYDENADAMLQASCATTAAPPMARRRVMRILAVNRPRSRSTWHNDCPDAELVSSVRHVAWDKALKLGEEARLPQRAGHRHRAHRHDRPCHGLRHHRH